MKRLWLCLFSTLLAVTGYAAPFSWTRTTDHFDTETRTYYNESLPVKISIPDYWEVVAKPEISKKHQGYMKFEEERGFEIAMLALHPSNKALVFVMIESTPLASFTPTALIKILKQSGRLKGYKEILLEERYLKGTRVADWEYEGIGFTYKELVFSHNDYVCRIRCFALSSVYHKFKPTFEEIIQGVSISHD